MGMHEAQYRLVVVRSASLAARVTHSSASHPGKLFALGVERPDTLKALVAKEPWPLGIDRE
jgi:hypothetical protein